MGDALTSDHYSCMATLNTQEVCEAVRLVAEVRTLLGFPELAASHLVDRLRAMTGSMLAGIGQRRASQGPGDIASKALALSGDASMVSLEHAQQLPSHPKMELPNSDAVLERTGRVCAASVELPQRRLCGVAARLYDDYQSLLGMYDGLMCKCVLPSARAVGVWVWLSRGPEHGRFAPHDSALVEFVMRGVSTPFWADAMPVLNPEWFLTRRGSSGIDERAARRMLTSRI